FKGADGEALPTERTLLDAHALGLGAELELTIIDLALRSESRLPEGLYLALNVSPALLDRDELLDIVARHDHSRPLVIEITEHHAVEDYGALDAALGRLRHNGVGVPVDVVGPGFV